MGEVNLSLSGSGGHPVLAQFLPLARDSQKADTVIWGSKRLGFPILVFSFPPSVAGLGSTHPPEMNASLILPVPWLGSQS